jgi:hypothetical protein
MYINWLFTHCPSCVSAVLVHAIILTGRGVFYMYRLLDYNEAPHGSWRLINDGNQEGTSGRLSLRIKPKDLLKVKDGEIKAWWPIPLLPPPHPPLRRASNPAARFTTRWKTEAVQLLAHLF